MAPAGHWTQLQTAIEAGADAVYFGLNHFSARAKVGFDLEELPEVIETLHQRGVKGFVTFNTLVFDHEIRQAEKAIMGIAAAGCDAIIVQDVGIAKLAKQIAPNLNIHGSTQMSITSAQGADLAASLGCSRVVLGRELSTTDIRKIASQTDVELEVFVHGALCVSYSGQCFSSEAWGGRSANRGKCAQACRLSYDLIVDGQKKDLGDLRYLLSPGDLYAIEQIPELIDVGVHCLKIEGRYKDENYVAVTTSAYRQAIDLAMMDVENEITPEELNDITQVYSRGLGPHFIHGINHQKVVDGRSPRNRGVRVGTVAAVTKKSVHVEVLQPMKRGDGVVFDAALWRSPDEPEEGGHIYEVTRIDDTRVKLEFGKGEINFSRIRAGDLVWRTRDAQLVKQLKPLTQPSTPVHTKAISFEVIAKTGQPIAVTATLENGLTASFAGEEPLAAAQKRALDSEALTEKLGRLGGTPYHLKDIRFENNSPVFLPTSQLNQVRRELVDSLFEQSGKVTPIKATPRVETLLEQRAQIPNAPDAPTGNINLHILVRSADQLDAAIAAQPSSITLDYLELYGLRDSAEKVTAAGIHCRAASPRVLKPSEQNVIKFLLSLECDILVRSAGLLKDLVEDPRSIGRLIGDFSLNAANFLSVEAYLAMGLKRITPTYDLNGQQIAELTEQIPAEKLEVIAYSHLPVFHMEHCVFCRFLSEGTDSSNCGHPCEKHQISIEDNQGRKHPVMADVGCRNTVFGAEVQFDGQCVEQWWQTGIKDFRIEFVHQTGDQITEVLTAFKSYFAGTITAGDLETMLNTDQVQTTQGSLFVAHDFKDLVELK